jgi:hypothetical protein
MPDPGVGTLPNAPQEPETKQKILLDLVGNLQDPDLDKLIKLAKDITNPTAGGKKNSLRRAVTSLSGSCSACSSWAWRILPISI